MKKMKITVSICNIIILSFCFVMWGGCSRSHKPNDERKVADSGKRERRFDPLDLRQDLEIVPLRYPIDGDIRLEGDFVITTDSVTEDSSYSKVVNLPDTIVTLNHQAYCVQLFTSKLYGEARRELMVAQEIFDRPVFLDYEVPYFKVRVGSFAGKEKAEEYQQRVRVAGYPNAWVVMVNVNVKEPEPLYPEGTPPVLRDSNDYYENVAPDD